MLPFAVAAAYLYAYDCRHEVRIVELEEDILVLRLAEKIDHLKQLDLEVLLYQADTSDYWKKKYKNIALDEGETTDFGFLYVFEPKDPIFSKKVSDLWRVYDRYAYLKLEASDSELSEEFIHYPAMKDEIFPDHFQEQQAAWYQEAMKSVQEHNMNSIKNAKIEKKSSALRAEYCQLALELDQEQMYEEFRQLSAADFCQKQFEKKQLLQHPLASEPLKRIYIGNCFCSNLFPKESILFPILQKAKAENLQITLVFPCMPQHKVEETKELIRKLYQWCNTEKETIEIEINDWGMLELLKQRGDCMVPILGRLLNKIRKDPRRKYLENIYKHGENAFSADSRGKFLEKNALSASFYRDYLEKAYGIRRYEWEAGGAGIDVPEGEHSLHIPYFQTNTSQYCPLYAACVEGDRGKQQVPEKCPGFCKEWAFLYPEHLQMVGKYNSLFGYDEKSLGDMEYLADFLKRGFDRIVVNLF